ncbi:hypothetical protein J6590_108490 [Homalodisca vitripennis]|nr:hypothetical protein J6590_108490 [Homalodisca vitripennis]
MSQLYRVLLPLTTNSFSSNIKFLGIYIDNQLNWNQHTEYISKRLSRVIYLLSRLKSAVPKNYVRTAYFAYFQAVFRYGLIFWGNCSGTEDILILQKKAIRLMTNSQPLEHCKPLFILLEIQTVINLYIFDLINYILKNPKFLKFNNEIHSYNTRTKNNAAIGYHRLSKTLNSHMVTSLKIYNFLEPLVNKYPHKTFTKLFYSWLLKHPFYSLDEFLELKNITF